MDGLNSERTRHRRKGVPKRWDEDDDGPGFRHVGEDYLRSSNSMDLATAKNESLPADFGQVVNKEMIKNVGDLFQEFWVGLELKTAQFQQYWSILHRYEDVLRSCSKSKIGTSSVRPVVSALRLCCDHPFLVDSSDKSNNCNIIPTTTTAMASYSAKFKFLEALLSMAKMSSKRVAVLYQDDYHSPADGNLSLKDLMVRQFDSVCYEHLHSKLCEDKLEQKKRKQQVLERFNTLEYGRFALFMEKRTVRKHTVKLLDVDMVVVFNSDWVGTADMERLSKVEFLWSFASGKGSSNSTINVFRLFCTNTVEENLARKPMNYCFELCGSDSCRWLLRRRVQVLFLIYQMLSANGGVVGFSQNKQDLQELATVLCNLCSGSEISVPSEDNKHVWPVAGFTETEQPETKDEQISHKDFWAAIFQASRSYMQQANPSDAGMDFCNQSILGFSHGNSSTLADGGMDYCDQSIRGFSHENSSSPPGGVRDGNQSVLGINHENSFEHLDSNSPCSIHIAEDSGAIGLEIVLPGDPEVGNAVVPETTLQFVDASAQQQIDGDIGDLENMMQIAGTDPETLNYFECDQNNAMQFGVVAQQQSQDFMMMAPDLVQADGSEELNCSNSSFLQLLHGNGYVYDSNPELMEKQQYKDTVLEQQHGSSGEEGKLKRKRGRPKGSTSEKRKIIEKATEETVQIQGKRGRGRPKGSKNKIKTKVEQADSSSTAQDVGEFQNAPRTAEGQEIISAQNASVSAAGIDDFAFLHQPNINPYHVSINSAPFLPAMPAPLMQRQPLDPSAFQAYPSYPAATFPNSFVPMANMSQLHQPFYYF